MLDLLDTIMKIVGVVPWVISILIVWQVLLSPYAGILSLCLKSPFAAVLP